jgi:NAD(P)-dependent dehydrogenase (short-subunit alcohol dehydrogenase family)
VGRRAVVTGAAKGIGQAIAEWLYQAGAEVIAIDNDAIGLKTNLKDTGCQIYEADLSEDIGSLVEEILRNGPVELIVNNVGVTTPQEFLDIEPPDLDLVWRTNVRGPWLLTKALVKALVEAQESEQRRPARRGSIVFISSLHDRFVTGESHYVATKAAVAAFSRSLAKQLADHRIRVNTISPGAIRTAPNPKSPEQRRKYKRLRRRIPLGQAGLPADIARAALFLLSDVWSGYITGQNLDVDGGLSLHNWRDT